MKWKTFLATVLISIVSSTLVFVLYSGIQNQKIGQSAEFENYDQPVRYVNLSGALPENSAGFTYSAEKSVNAVVHVKTQYQQEAYYNSLYEFFFGNPSYVQPKSVASGSGVIISSNGYIVTNNHVIDGSQYIEVVLNDKRTYKAELVGTDPKTDLALLKIDVDKLPAIGYGDSDQMRIGEWVLAVGNPFNLTSTVTAGIISAKARNLNILSQYSIESFIQTDAAVNPGNSGGALVNTKGELIGINTAIASNTGSYTGYSFAIPVNIVKKVVADIIEFGEVQRAYIGVFPKDIDAELAEKIGLDKIMGVYVDGVNEKGAAEEAGIKVGDIVTHIGAIEVNSVNQLQEQISKYRPGDEVKISFLRGSDVVESVITLKNSLGNTEIIKSENIYLMGAKFQGISGDEKYMYRISNGMKIVDMKEGELANAGIKKGFIITRINGKKVFSREDLDAFLGNASGVIQLEGIYPNGTTAYYSFSVK